MIENFHSLVNGQLPTKPLMSLIEGGWRRGSIISNDSYIVSY